MNCKRIEKAVSLVKTWAEKLYTEKGVDYHFPAAFEKDFAIVKEIFSREEFNNADRAKLLQIYNVSWHDTGKIAGISSCDSSAHACEFCEKMVKAAEKDSSIICGYCYDMKQEILRFSTLLRHAINLEIMATVEFTQDELKAVKLTDIDRINSSGDTPNRIYALNMIRIIYNNPDCKVGFWGKNTPAIDSAIEQIGKPANMVYIQSSIHINRPDKMSKYADYLFTVYTEDKIPEALARGACECNGKKCKACGYKCYFGLWPRGAEIAEKLRL